MREAMGNDHEARALVEPASEGAVPAAPEPARYNKRSKTVDLRRVSKRQLQMWHEPVDEALFADRPKTRGECAEGLRPCPYVSCKHHLYLDVNEDTGSLILNFPNKEVEDLEESCSLDVAARGGATLEEVGEFFQVTSERVRQIEVNTLVKLKKHKLARDIFADGRHVRRA